MDTGPTSHHRFSSFAASDPPGQRQSPRGTEVGARPRAMGYYPCHGARGQETGRRSHPRVIGVPRTHFLKHTSVQQADKIERGPASLVDATEATHLERPGYGFIYLLQRCTGPCRVASASRDGPGPIEHAPVHISRIKKFGTLTAILGGALSLKRS